MKWDLEPYSFTKRPIPCMIGTLPHTSIEYRITYDEDPIGLCFRNKSYAEGVVKALNAAFNLGRISNQDN